ncbi:MAG: hypothetical protein AMXMBFR81_13260 [Chthonomonas sp.]
MTAVHRKDVQLADMTTRRRRQTGFTLIEMMVVTAILALVAMTVFPNLARIQDAGRKREFVRSLTSMAREAREQAILSASTVSLRLDDTSLVIESAGALEEDARTLRTKSMPDGFSAQRTNVDGLDSSSAEWELRFYADGSSDRGGIELADDTGALYSLVIDNDRGQARLVSGELPVLTEETWQAGEIERRG